MTDAAGPVAWLVNLVIFLSFFPFFRYIPLGDIEVQPAAAAVATFGLLVFGFVGQPPTRAVMALLVVIAGEAVFTVLGLSVAPLTVIQQAVAYAAPLPILLFLWDRLDLVRWRVVLFSGVAYLLVGLMQLFGLLPAFADAILTSAIARYQPGLGGGGRGVVMLAPEPDYASRQLVLFVAFGIFFFLSRRISKRVMAIVVAVNVMAMLMLNRSVTGILILTTLLLAIPIVRLNLRTRVLAVALMAGSAFGLWVAAHNIDVSNVTEDSPRVVQIGANLLQSAVRGGVQFTDIVQFASARIVTSIAGTRAIVNAPWFGAGIGRSEQTVIAAIQNDPLLATINFPFADFGNLKPQAWLTAFVLETGVAGAVVFTVVIFTLFPYVMRFAPGTTERAFAVACLVTGILQIALLGPHSLPEPWLLFVLISAHLGGRA